MLADLTELPSPYDGTSAPHTRPTRRNPLRLLSVNKEAFGFRRVAMQVHDIMHSDVQLADPNMTIRDAARRMRTGDIGALPVGENDRLIGMVTDRDIVVRAIAEDRSPANTTVREVMSEGVCYCFEDDDVGQAAQVMAKHQVRRLPVLNRNKRLVGVVALADLGHTGETAAQGALKGISEPTGKERR
jgi:CBS domain-containing protein